MYENILQVEEQLKFHLLKYYDCSFYFDIAEIAIIMSCLISNAWKISGKQVNDSD